MWNSVYCLRLSPVLCSPRPTSCQAMHWQSLPACLWMSLKGAAWPMGNPWSCFPLFSQPWPVQRRTWLMGKVTPYQLLLCSLSSLPLQSAPKTFAFSGELNGEEFKKQLINTLCSSKYVCLAVLVMWQNTVFHIVLGKRHHHGLCVLSSLNLCPLWQCLL